jgi:signal transduction histidine kinase/ActR/RegA family two-component response regulator
MGHRARSQEWRESLLLTVTRWSALLGAVVAAGVAAQMLLSDMWTAHGPALVVMYVGYAAIVGLHFAARLGYTVRAVGLCAACLVTASGAILLRGLAPGPVLVLAVCVVVAGLTLGRVALFASLTLAATIVFFLGPRESDAPFGRIMTTIGFVSVSGALAVVVQFVVSRLESTIHEISRAADRLRAEQSLREQTQQDLARLQSALYQTQKLDAVGKLAGGVAHDFNNTLQVVLGWTEILRDTTDPDQIREGIEEIRAAATGSSRLTRQLLAFSRPDLRAPIRVDLNEVLPSVVASYRRLMPDDVSVVLEMDQGLSIEIDRGHLTQALLNLVLNARDAMPGGGVLELNARLRPSAPLHPPAAGSGSAGTVEITVSDNGSGMDEATKARAFDPFFTTKGTQGTGLGLSTVYGVVHQAGGTIDVESAPGKGSSFTLRFPLAAPLVDRRPAVDPVRSPIHLRPQRVLLAEDDRGVRASLAEALRRSGRTVLEVGDVESGRGVLAEQGPGIDVLVTDGIMPQGNTRDLIADFVRARPDGRVIVCSGYIDNELARRDLGGQAFELMLKPFAPSELISRLDQGPSVTATSDEPDSSR